MKLSPVRATTCVEPSAGQTNRVNGTILHLQRLSTEDGPGIRTTAFFKGCPLHCSWCHNPESISPRPQVHWLENRCIGCWSCIEACSRHGLTRSEDGILRDRKICTACGECVAACPSGAMEMLGYRVDAGDLVIELLKDKAYFDKSGGGVTLSGGEPTLQPDFAVALAEGLKRNGISVALDTCGLCSRQTLETLLPLVDLVLYDLKLIDPLEHEKWTGVSNQRILDNLIWLADAIHTRWPEKKLWIRTPLIPGATLTQENIRGIGEFLENLPLETVERWELCAFNNLCRDKYRRLEMEWTFSDTTLITAAELELAGEWAKASGIDSILVSVTGAARVEN